MNFREILVLRSRAFLFWKTMTLFPSSSTWLAALPYFLCAGRQFDHRIPIITEKHNSTCFFVIGLIASTEQGAEILSDYGWIAATTALGEPTGMCVPEDISKFMAV